MKKAIVTGATSMIGAALTNELIANEVTVYAVVRHNCTKLDRLPQSKYLKIIECEISDYGSLKNLITERCDTFYHIAWQATGAYEIRNSQFKSQALNIAYTLDALNAAYELGCKKFIGAGSQAEFGNLDIDKISPDSTCDPVQPYGIAKYSAGKLAMEEANRLNMDCLWVRIFSVYGLYMGQSTLISSTINKMIKHEKLSFTKAEQRWDFLYEEDAGKAFYAIGEKSTGSKVYCLGSGKADILKNYIYKIRDIIAPDMELNFGDIPYRENEVMNLCADIQKLQLDTGWAPKISFEDGIKQIIKELKKISKTKGNTA